MHSRGQGVEDDSVADVSARRDRVERGAQSAANNLELSARKSSCVVDLCCSLLSGAYSILEREEKVLCVFRGCSKQ